MLTPYVLYTEYIIYVGMIDLKHVQNILGDVNINVIIMHENFLRLKIIS